MSVFTRTNESDRAKRTLPYLDGFGKLTVGLATVANKPIYCTWRLIPDPARPNKAKKIPCVRGGKPLMGSFADPALSTKLMSLDEAIHAVSKNGHHGVGLVFMPDCGVVGLDLDGCIVDGVFEGTPEQRDAVNAFSPYAFIEISQSAKGLHAIALGAAATNKLDGVLELFGNKNFLALTGINGSGVASEMPATEIARVDQLIRGLKGDFSRVDKKAHGNLTDLTGHLKALLGQESIEVVRHALQYLDPSCDRDTWMRVIWGIHHGLGDTPEARELADQWSKGRVHESN